MNEGFYRSFIITKHLIDQHDRLPRHTVLPMSRWLLREKPCKGGTVGSGIDRGGEDELLSRLVKQAHL
jgi:hypothetical protein